MARQAVLLVMKYMQQGLYCKPIVLFKCDRLEVAARHSLSLAKVWPEHAGEYGRSKRQNFAGDQVPAHVLFVLIFNLNHEVTVFVELYELSCSILRRESMS